MKLGFMAAAALQLAAGAALAATPVPAAELQAVADRFDKAQIEQDRAALEEMVTDDLVFVDSDGVRRGRGEFISGWLDPALKFSPVTITDRYVVPLGPDVGVVGGEAVLRGTASGKPFSSRIRFSDTFRRIGGRWLAVHIQSTRVKAAPQ